MALVYAELRRIAHVKIARERAEHTLQSAALVNEAYLRLIDQRRVRWKNRAQFFAIAAQMMRRVLVDYARKRQRSKRGGGVVRFDSLSPAEAVVATRGRELLAVDDALTDLAGVDPRKVRIVELRYFVGLSVEETAEILGIAPRTVMREWGLARAWLHRTVSKEATDVSI